MKLAIQNLKFSSVLFFLVSLLLSIDTLSADLVKKSPKTIVVTSDTALRGSSFFGNSKTMAGFLEKGTKAEILSIDTDKVYGAGVRVRITSGPHIGKVGWVYYAKDPSKRKISFLGKEGDPVDFDQDNFSDEIDNVKNHYDKLGFRVFSTKSKKPAVLRETEDDIWDKVFTGEYQIDNDQDQGGPRLPIKRTFIDANGNPQSHVIYIDRNVNRLMALPTQIREGLAIPISCLDKPGPANGPEAFYKDWLPGCDILSTKLYGNSYKKLQACMNSIKKTALQGAGSGNNINRDIVYKNLYSKLNKKEQEFAAMTLTSFGEAGILAPPLEEMVMVMKILNNRKNYAINKGFDQANELDSALQHKQFSMWNKKDPNWKRALRASEGNPQTENSIKAYIQYQNSSYSSNTEVNKIYHYHTNYVSADWSAGKTHNPVKVNGKLLKQKGTRHKFFAKVPWSFKYNKEKKKHLAK